MNDLDLNTAAERTEESTEAREFVELGEVTKDTKGFFSGPWYDNHGWWG